MAVDVSKLESHELASPGRWHVLCRNPLTLDAGVVHFVDGQSVALLDWPALRRAVASIGHEFLVARREDGVTVPEGDRWIEEARGCMGTRVLRDPWASLLAVPKEDAEDDAEDDGSGEGADTQNASEGDEGEGEPENVSMEAAPGVPTAGDVPQLGPEDLERLRAAKVEPIEIAVPEPVETPAPVETPELVEKPKRARKRKNASEGDEG